MHRAPGRLFVVLSFVLTIAFFLIADIDSRRHGVIAIVPENLAHLAASLDRS